MANEKMRYVGDVCFGAGKYTDSQGQEKTRWVKCGAYFQAGDRRGVKLEFVPVGIDPVRGLWFSLFPEKKKVTPPQQPVQPSNNPAPPADDEVPF